MAQATTTTAGEIVLGGDLTGTATYPELRATGVIPGTYAPVQRMTVDAKGRVLSAGVLSGAEVSAILPVASSSVLGGVKVGANLQISSSILSVENATSSTKGVFSVGAGLSVLDGDVSIDWQSFRLATSVLSGLVYIGNSFSMTSDVISYSSPNASASVIGLFQAGTGLQVKNETLQVADATDSTLGVTIPANTSNLSLSAGGALNIGSNVPTIAVQNTFTKAQVSAIYDDTASISSGSYVPDFTRGQNLYVNATSSLTLDGTISGRIIGGLYNLIVKNSSGVSRTFTFNYRSSPIVLYAGGVQSIVVPDGGYAVLSLISIDGTYFLGVVSPSYS